MKRFISCIAVSTLILCPYYSLSQTPDEQNLKKVKSEVFRFQDFIRFSFESDDYLKFTPVIDGEMLILDFDDANDINLSDVAQASKVIRSFGASPDNRSIIIRLNRSGLKLRRFVGDNFSTGFDVFFDDDKVKSRKRVVMSTIDGSAEQNLEDILASSTDSSDVTSQGIVNLAEGKYNNIITYPIDFVGPPRIEQLFRLDSSFIGPKTKDFETVARYEIIKTFDDGTLAVEIIPTKDGLMVMLPFKNVDDVTAATYKLGDDLHSVYDLKRKLIASAIPENKFFESIEQVDHDGLTILKIKTKKPKGEDAGYRVLNYKDKFSWIIEFTQNLTGDFAIKPLKIKAENNWGENRIIISSNNMKGPFDVKDPLTEENIKVFTVGENGSGLLLQREFIDLEFRESLQGYFIYEKSDFIEYKRDDSGIVFITKLPNLEISEEIIATDFSIADGGDEAISKTVGIFPEQSIFPFPKSIAAENALLEATEEAKEGNLSEKDDESEDGLNQEQSNNQKFVEDLVIPQDVSLSDVITSYLDKIVNAPEEDKSLIKFELAKLYFANEMYPESRGVLQDILITDPEFKDIFKVQSIIQATLFLSGKYVDAYEGFNLAAKEALNNSSYNEIKLWKWASEYLVNKQNRYKEYNETKIDFVAGFDKFMQQYTEELRFKLGFLYIQRQIDKGDIEEAKNALDIIVYGDIPETVENDIKYYRAKLYELDEDYEQANQIYEQLVNDVDDRKNRARALFAITKYKLVHGIITTDEAIQQFLLTATIWRDDYFEMDAMETVGSLYLTKNQYGEALHAWKNLVLNFPQTTESVFVLGKMKEVFIELFDKGIAYEMEPLEALKLYFQYRELIPVGEIGDRITRKVAQFFIEADMVEDAEDIIQHQINFRSQKEEKAKLVLWLSKIYLENQKKVQAEKIFETLEQENLSKETKDLIRYAIAMSRVKRGLYFETLEMIRDDRSFAADTVRLELFWLRRNWFGIIDIVESREENYNQTLPNAFTEQETADIIKVAVAYAAQNMDEKLVTLSEKYKSRIEDEKSLNLFDYLRSGSQNLDYKKFEESLELDKIEDFLINYSFMENKDWDTTIEILEPKIQKLVGTVDEDLTRDNKLDIVKLALAYSLFEHEDEKIKKEAEKKLAGLSRDFKSVRVDRFTIEALKVLDSKSSPIENDAIFEGQIKLIDIPRFVPFYEAANKMSEMNISVRGKFE